MSNHDEVWATKLGHLQFTILLKLIGYGGVLESLFLLHALLWKVLTFNVSLFTCPLLG
jgi:hypothetical protein